MELDKEKDTGGRKKKLLFGRNRAAGAFAVIAAIAAAGAAVVQPFLMNERFYCEYANYYEGLSDRQAALARAKYCRDSVYSDLCALGTVYLSNCKNGIYGGSRELYESLYGGLSQFDEVYTSQAENIFGLENAGTRALKIEQSKYTITTIDSDYYYFYVSFGDEYLTNMSDLVRGNTPSETLDALITRYPRWYYRRDGSTIRTKTKYDESGLNKTEVYYTTAGSDGSPTLTSEYIDSDKLLFGNCSTDNYGRYTYCFDGGGDRVIPMTESLYDFQLGSDGSLHISQQVMNEQTGEPMTDGYVEFTVSKDDEDYRSIIAQNGGVLDAEGNWVDVRDMPDYEMAPLDMSKLTVFMSPKTDIVAASESFIKKHSQLKTIFSVARISLIALTALCSAAALISVIVRRKEKYAADGTPLIYGFFKTDISLILLGAAGTQFVYFIMRLIYGAADVYLPELVRAGCQAGGSLLVLLLSFAGLIRQLKLHGFRERHDFLAVDIWRSTEGIRRKLKERFYNSAVMRSFAKLRPVTRHRLRFFAALISGAVLLLFTALSIDRGKAGLLLVMPAAVVFAISLLAFLICADITAKDIGALEEQTEKMLGEDGGEIRTAKNELDISSPVYALGEKLESVSEAAESAVEERLKSERMKIELVTNVSHDLKTPLTSIISYIDLLSKSELSDEARDYVSILSRKADKLRDIVSDVFTLAKAVSGVEVDLADLDFAMLARQAAADISDKAETSGRELKTDVQPAKAPIVADGSKLYRVIQNLLDNALKYSMEGSRVYMTLSERESGDYELEVRNICETEPDFTAEEILERFVRGDKSRTDGGSGLGLSIAKSFTEACGGSFDLVIDKDLFTARVRFPRREEAPPPEEPQDEPAQEQTED